MNKSFHLPRDRALPPRPRFGRTISIKTDIERPFISTPRNNPHHSVCTLPSPSTLSSQHAWYVHYHLSSTASIIGGTTYGQNITTATTGKYIIILPPTFFHCAPQAACPCAPPALAALATAYVLNCWIAGRWILVRASAESTGLRARGDIVLLRVSEWRLVCLAGLTVCSRFEIKRALRYK